MPVIDIPGDLERAAAVAGMKLSVHPRDCGGTCPDCEAWITTFVQAVTDEIDREILRSLGTQR